MPVYACVCGICGECIVCVYRVCVCVYPKPYSLNPKCSLYPTPSTYTPHPTPHTPHPAFRQAGKRVQPCVLTLFFFFTFSVYTHPFPKRARPTIRTNCYGTYSFFFLFFFFPPLSTPSLSPSRRAQRYAQTSMAPSPCVTPSFRSCGTAVVYALYVCLICLPYMSALGPLYPAA